MQKEQELLKKLCDIDGGILSNSFLCESVGSLELADPITASEDATLLEVMDLLVANRIGCVLIVGGDDSVTGIFSERDYLLKVWGKLSDAEMKQKRISELMTKEPHTVDPTASLAYALSIMSKGGFRHLPIVDQDSEPIAMLSVKDMIDLIVERSLSGLEGVR